MKKMQKLIILMIVIGGITSCDTKPPFTYLHADKEQTLECTGVDAQLLNEALYTFEDDLMYGYGAEDGTLLSAAYGRFLFTGFSGTAEYEQFASAHALEVKEALVAAGIIIQGGAKSNLNYNHPAVQCILDKVEDTGLAQTLNALVDTNTMDPKLFNSRMRNLGRNAERQRYLALYTALDAYYQQLTVARPLEQVNE